MVRVDKEHWLKTGIEFVDGRIRFSTVVTLAYSSWAVADLPPSIGVLGLQLARRKDAVEVRYSIDGGAAELAAIAYLPPGKPAFAGALCAAPDGAGFEASFFDLTITPIA
jgi:regulation of enolase protein 1 (concanavalin A-like superfamily)